MTKKQAIAALNSTRVPDNTGDVYREGWTDGAFEAIEALDRAGAFQSEETAAEIDASANVQRGGDAAIEALDAAGAFTAEPTITKAQAERIWDLACTEPGLVGYFDEAWAEVTGAKP